MSRSATHTAYLTARQLRALSRQPAYFGFLLIQPVIWLLLFGQLFTNVIRLPGFAPTTSYLEFITPGVIVMTALFNSGWSGTAYIEDMNRGVMDRLLASPVRRGSMIAGTLTYQVITTTLQTLVIFAIAYAAGARFAAPARGVGITLLAAALIAMIIASFSNAVGLLVRQQEALIGISQFIVLPLQFLSSGIMDTRLSPTWVGHVATFNPVDWAVVASREALDASPDWSLIGGRLGLLAAAAGLMAVLATRAFAAYRRSL
jgi:ABC-2 type transport system permease protein